MKDSKVQWHPGLVAAMNLELAENRHMQALFWKWVCSSLCCLGWK